eukprot:CAMPEP_0194280308 /NCGR_PEP_ID=MMETSP0169-20130528/16882_1 /TAXON_ID=218684 /ORGANISM="Corethron pennatum, Strain L29A3" /LENGTH=42 /DNA_ID= /DNA_START= /DNA_END= /DNA_ORIENTATION=
MVRLSGASVPCGHPPLFFGRTPAVLRDTARSSWGSSTAARSS